MKHTYHLESFAISQWLKILEGRSLQYCQGFLDARCDYAPRTAYRLVRSDGKIMEEVEARDDVVIGQIAGWPTAEQYENAANKALERAKAIRAKAQTEDVAIRLTASEVIHIQNLIASNESNGEHAAPAVQYWERSERIKAKLNGYARIKHGDECLDCNNGRYLRIEIESDYLFHLRCDGCGMNAYFPKDGGPYPPCCTEG